MPAGIETVHREFKDRGLEVLAVNLGELREVVAAWLEGRGVTSTVLLDPEGLVARAYHVGFTPTVVLVTRDGRLRGKALGVRDWAGADGRRLIRALLAD